MRNNLGRITGRKAVALRLRRLAEHPLCAMCKEKGRVTATQEIDHVIPLHAGGEDIDDNCQGLCKPCHVAKTSLEDAGNHAAANHPVWLRRSAIPLTIVSGPPCSGKTTFVNTNAQSGDVVICLDTIMMEINQNYKHWDGALSSGLLNRAVRARNARLGSLSRAEAGRAWFIVSAPAEAERAWWQRNLGGELVLLHPGVDECKRRAIARGTPAAVDGVEAWERKSRMPWTEPVAKQAKPEIGLDGWVIGR